MMETAFNYQYRVPSPYPLTPQHQKIHVSIDDKTLTPPEARLQYDTLTLGYSDDPKAAQIHVYVHIQPSFLVQREPISRQVVEFDNNNKGKVKYVMTNRGFIRTPFSIELVDMLNNTLIFDTRGAGNYPIDALPKPMHSATTQQLQQSFHQHTKQARQTLLNTIWQNLKGVYLTDIQVEFVNTQLSVVSEHKDEPVFSQAFLLLKKNDQRAAKKALALYNKAYKEYAKKSGDDNKRILNWINDGITVAAKIANGPVVSDSVNNTDKPAGAEASAPGLH